MSQTMRLFLMSARGATSIEYGFAIALMGAVAIKSVDCVINHVLVPQYDSVSAAIAQKAAKTAPAAGADHHKQEK